MKYKFTALIGIASGIIMSLLWGMIFTNIIGDAGALVGIIFGISFACLGGLAGYSIDKRHNRK